MENVVLFTVCDAKKHAHKVLRMKRAIYCETGKTGTIGI